MTFNWTNVELKYNQYREQISLLETFNWTNVELKYYYDPLKS